LTLLIFYILIALVLSFICSVMEAVLLSITPAYTAQMIKSNRRKGLRIKRLKDDIETPLAAILSLNTLAHTIGAAGAGAQAASIFGDEYLGLISGVLTLLILIFSEIIPKTLGAIHWKILTPNIILLLRLTMIIMYPLVKLSRFVTNMLSSKTQNNLIDKDEFQALMEIAVKQGVFEDHESAVLKNIMLFKKISAEKIMTPRTVLYALNEDTTVSEIIDQEPDMPFSRIPVFSKDIDSITGFVLKSDILLKAVSGNKNDAVKTIKREIIAFPEQLNIFAIFDSMIKNSDHIALVLDEYGGTAGIVTLEDIIETLTGIEIVDEKDIAQDMQVHAKKKWENRIHIRKRRS